MSPLAAIKVVLDLGDLHFYDSFDARLPGVSRTPNFTLSCRETKPRLARCQAKSLALKMAVTFNIQALNRKNAQKYLNRYLRSDRNEAFITLYRSSFETALTIFVAFSW